MLSSLLVNTILEFLVNATRQEKEIKGIQIYKKRRKFTLIQRLHDFQCKSSYKIYKKLLKVTSELARSQAMRSIYKKYVLFTYKSNIYWK